MADPRDHGQHGDHAGSKQDQGLTSGSSPAETDESGPANSLAQAPSVTQDEGEFKPLPAIYGAEVGKTGIPTSNSPANIPIREKPSIKSPPPPEPPPKDAVPIAGVAAGKRPESQEREFDEKHPPEDDSIADPRPDVGADNDSRSEIQCIMEQFAEDGVGPGKEEILSPRLEIASPVFFPARGSSLDPDSSGSPKSLKRHASRDSYTFKPNAARPHSLHDGLPPPPPPDSEKPDTQPQSPSSQSIFQPPPPSPDPEPSLPFDFHRFLEQLRHRTADPVARFLRSFLNEFGKKQWQVHEQVKIISDFLEFISKKMAHCEVWRSVSDAEFDNAKEGMEKLVMNRLYSQTFSPAIPAVEAISHGRPRRLRTSAAATSGPGRRGQHQEDVERDDVIAQKIRIYGWIKEEHLDMPTVGEKGRRFLLLAQQELLKINSYRAPRDKVIVILNCCKVIFGFLKNNKTDQSADSFVPLLIYTVLKANPQHLVSNVQYILRFRNQDKLGGEAGYYISSLMGVIAFIENLDRTNLTISDAEFEQNVEVAVSAITEGHQTSSYEAATAASPTASPTRPARPGNAGAAPDTSPLLAGLSEKSAPARPEVTPRNSSEVDRAQLSTPPRRNPSKRTDPSSQTRPTPTTTTSGAAEDLATGLLRTIQKPLSGIGRMFSDDHAQPPAPPTRPPGQPRSSTDLPPSSRHPGSDPSRQGQHDGEVMRFFAGNRSATTSRPPPGARETDETAMRRAGAVSEAEGLRSRREEERLVVETLQGMFPDLDKEVIGDVVRMKEGRVGLAVDACLALSAG